MSTAKHSKAYRDRLKKGVRMVQVPVAPVVVQALIAGGLLAEKDEGDPAAVADALARATQTLAAKIIRHA